MTRRSSLDARCTATRCRADAPSPQRERALILCAQQGCRAAMNRLMAEAYPSVQALARATYPRAQDRDDLVHEALLELQSAVRRYDLTHPGRVRLTSFGRKAMLGAMARYYRRSLPHAELSSDAHQEIIGEVDRELDAARLPSLLAPLLGSLDARSREILEQRVMTDRPVDLRSLATRYRVSHPRVHALQHHALRRVLSLLLKSAPDLAVR
jgi:RNA polymerase sigma factor (sigma-70 family)